MRAGQENFLRLFLRIVGSVSLLAFFCMLMPHAWMNATHQWLGMGRLPDEPIVGYLAKSTCAFYALLGGLLWVLSFDLRRHRFVLCYLGATFIFFGLLLFCLDLLEGLPLFWRLCEGPIDATFGIIILYMSYRIGRQAPAPETDMGS
jgi:hypothetical protein